MTTRKFTISLISIAIVLVALITYCFMPSIDERMNRDMQSWLANEDKPILRDSLAYRFHLMKAEDVLARICHSYYVARNPIADAHLVAGGSPYIYFAFHYANDAGFSAPGFDGECDRPFINQNQDQRVLRYFSAIEWGNSTDRYQEECISSASDYGKKFNNTIKLLNPLFFERACHEIPDRVL